MATFTTGMRNNAKLEVRAGKEIRRSGSAFMTHTEYLLMTTAERYDICDITEALQAVLERSGIVDGTMLAATMHITSSIFINDHEPGLWQDILTWVEKLAPFGFPYAHHHTGEDNGDAHLKRMLLGHQVIVPITDGAFDFGPWERVHYAEFDGRRPKRIIVKAQGLGA